MKTRPNNINTWVSLPSRTEIEVPKGRCLTFKFPSTLAAKEFHEEFLHDLDSLGYELKKQTDKQPIKRKKAAA